MLLRPVREALGLSRGLENVRRLFLVTVLCTLPLVPLFGWLVSRCSARKLTGVSFRICALILVGFCVGLTFLPEHSRSLLASGYYVLHSVFNLFVVSLFWAVMADPFGLAESKRWFPAITLGGSLGAIVGSLIAWQLVRHIGVNALFLLAVLPVLAFGGFSMLAAVPTLAAFMLVNALFRAAQQGIAGPAQQTLFTVLERQDKYKAKSFLDTFGYRAGDAAGAYLERALAVVGSGIIPLAVAVLGLSGIWLMLCRFLGRTQARLATEEMPPHARNREGNPAGK